MYSGKKKKKPWEVLKNLFSTSNSSGSGVSGKYLISGQFDGRGREKSSSIISSRFEERFK
jgi:hypothetical protein